MVLCVMIIISLRLSAQTLHNIKFVVHIIFIIGQVVLDIGYSVGSVYNPFLSFPFSAGGKTEGEEGNGVDASLLVTLEINNTVYQGVLFAKPQSASSPQR